ncbi:hypothetical protein AVEN_273531-1 [Araneus ventricosus]|uniref:Uncharacterized protein n=1 Tax=Araneus ventricosus TaxID=182803 RepID=A0A4Y2H7D2_ARAVE|nr:hypothetical protein AVEN_273531-1 [Araneus ventricosus]
MCYLGSLHSRFRCYRKNFNHSHISPPNTLFIEPNPAEKQEGRFQNIILPILATFTVLRGSAHRSGVRFRKPLTCLELSVDWVVSRWEHSMRYHFRFMEGWEDKAGDRKKMRLPTALTG